MFLYNLQERERERERERDGDSVQVLRGRERVTIRQCVDKEI
jgi:hypothetical protein